MQQLTLADLDEPRALARRSDPITSHLAAQSVAELQLTHFTVILTCLKKHGPLGKDGIAARSRLDGVQICRRLVQLERKGLAQPTGRTVPSTSGRDEREWSLA